MFVVSFQVTFLFMLDVQYIIKENIDKATLFNYIIDVQFNN